MYMQKIMEDHLGQYLLLDLALLAFLFFGMLLFWELGRKLGGRQKNSEYRRAQYGIRVMEGAVFALMGLLIAFTFSAANMRFEARRQLMIQEVNAIGTAYLRLNLLQPDDQLLLRDSFRHYLDLRIASYRHLSIFGLAKSEMQKISLNEILLWRQAVAAVHRQNSRPPALLLLPAINQMFEAANSRMIIVSFHMPLFIFLLLISLAFTSAILAGYDIPRNKKHGSIHFIGFIIIVVLTIYTIFSFEFPRLGLVKNPDDVQLKELRRHL